MKNLNWITIILNMTISDQFIFYYSGHGEILKGQLFLVLPESKKEDIWKTGYNFREIYDNLYYNNISKGIAIVDACHSGGISDSFRKLSGKDYPNLPKGFGFLAACAKSDYANFSEQFEKTYFTHYLCEGINTGCNNNSIQHITLSMLRQYINEKIKNNHIYLTQEAESSAINVTGDEIWVSLNPKFHDISKTLNYFGNNQNHMDVKLEELRIIEYKPSSLLWRTNTPKDMFLYDEVEGQMLEYKTSARWDHNKNEVNEFLINGVIKTIAAFLNSSGGKLIIGVDDKGKVLGLENDYSRLKKKNRDGFFLFLTYQISTRIGKAFDQYIQINFCKENDKEICIILIEPSKQPAFVKEENNRKAFYVRTGKATQFLNSQEMLEYCKLHWQDEFIADPDEENNYKFKKLAKQKLEDKGTNLYELLHESKLNICTEHLIQA